MASLIPGYEYDIFISYRQKDNKYDGWVTEFVDNLKKELEATFKEDVSVYFDINPHDGLLETHDVDASLKVKLKCLVFIPIISQTYCDSKSFAWEHEFAAFIDQASKDQFGLKVKLPNGNVANRVLPVRIHDLDNDDIKLCESLLGGVLRGVEFIYKEPGVNKPLTSEDDEKKNLNKTKYRIQINKIANAIKEIVSGLIAGEDVSAREKAESQLPWEEAKIEPKLIPIEKRANFIKSKLLYYIISSVLVILFIAVYAYPKLFRSYTLEKLRTSGERVSIAVMPFKNMSNDTTLNFWQAGIQSNLITSLSNNKEFKVQPSVSITSLLRNKGITDYGSFTSSVAGEISRKLDANVFIYGSIIKEGSVIRLNVQLINSMTNEVFKPFQMKGSEDNIMPIIDTLSWEVRDFLIISKIRNEDKSNYTWSLPKSAEGYKYLVLGGKAWRRSDFKSAIDNWLQAIKADSNIYDAYSGLAYTNLDMGNYEEGKKWLLKYYSKLDKMDMLNKTFANYLYAFYLKTPDEAIRYAQQMVLISEGPTSYFNLGDIYCQSNQFEKAIPAFEKLFEIYHKLNSKPFHIFDYVELGSCYHKTGQYKKERKLYKKAEQDFPDNFYIIKNQAILSLSEGDTTTANRYIEKELSSLKDDKLSEADLKGFLGYIYSEAGNLNKAEEYYRKALSLEPDSLVRMYELGHFLINKDKNINEGMQLIDKVLKSRPEDFDYWDVKGWGFYKQGKYKEALVILQKSWDLRMKNAICNNEAFLHLEAAKKAVANKK